LSEAFEQADAATLEERAVILRGHAQMTPLDGPEVPDV